MKNIFLLAIGGIIGTISRYTLGEIITKYFALNIIFATLSVNLIGSFLIGFFYPLISMNQNLKLLFITGFCGAFTTFSALIFDSNYLSKNHGFLIMILYILSSIIFGYAFFKLGNILSIRVCS